MSDSWAHYSISDVELNLNGFNLLRSDRLFNKGGGCVLYVRELNRIIIVDDLTILPILRQSGANLLSSSLARLLVSVFIVLLHLW